MLERFGTAVERKDFGTGPVVRQEKHHRVLKLTRLLQCGKDVADALIHPVHLGCIDLHAAGFPGFVFRMLPSWLLWIALALVHRICQQPGFAQALHSSFTQHIPAFVVASMVFGNVLFSRLQRPVRRGVGDIHEEGLIRL